MHIPSSTVAWQCNKLASQQTGPDCHLRGIHVVLYCGRLHETPFWERAAEMGTEQTCCKHQRKQDEAQRARQGKARQGKARQGKARQGSSQALLSGNITRASPSCADLR